jgi:hypothetical protein
MKQKKINKKLLLSKVTVVNLNNLEMNGVNGGDLSDTCPPITNYQTSTCGVTCGYTCPETCVNTCNTCDCGHPTGDPTHCVTC